MKNRSYFSRGLAVLFVLSATGLIAGCNSSESSDAAATDATKTSAATANATPPPTANVSGAQAQQSAAQQASEEMRKKFEAGELK